MLSHINPKAKGLPTKHSASSSQFLRGEERGEMFTVIEMIMVRVQIKGRLIRDLKH